ncbi:MAG: thiol oxidoreductase, partial [Ferruginibacter sp.]|nr:thiol oxidoreductase [Ferruginibacter sp.]
MKNTYLVICFIVALVFIIQACAKLEPAAPKDDELLDGPVAGLTNDQNARFLAGDLAFNDEIFTPQKGLGPLFVASSCGSCHAGDGKGTPFTTLTRFGQKDSSGNQFLHLGGPQLQNRALPGFNPEQIPIGATFSKFTPPANTGLGFLELVSDADLLAMSDPTDANGDGISGVPNYGLLPSFITPFSNAIALNGKYIHRFGKKPAAYNLLHQTVNAYNQDMGITSSFSPVDAYSGQTIDPEVTDLTVKNIVFYLQTLKVPVQRTPADVEVVKGKNIFMQLKCNSCHVPQLKTGYSPIDALSNKTFFPYTDMLLHDMGTGLDDGYTEGSATTAEWRTPALWGLGLSPKSQGGKYFLMHDGRATSIEQAINMHAGEGLQSKNNFNQLAVNERNALLK